MDQGRTGVMFGMRVLALALLATIGLVKADLPLPPNLIPLSSTEGQRMLLDAQNRADYFLLAQHFVTQINAAFCGPASSVTVLNALNGPRPKQDPEAGFTNPSYAYYTQVNVFDNNTEKVVPQANVRKEGMSLSELSLFLAAHEGVGSSFIHSDPTLVTVDMFRDTLLRALGLPGVFVIVNFDRSVIMEMGGGHHSPVAAYHRASDSVLVLDVSRYKYVAWWVPVTQLYASTSTTTDSSSHLTRGLVVVWATAEYGPQLDPAAVPPGTDNGVPLVTATAIEIEPADEETVGLSSGAVTGLAVAMLVTAAVTGLVMLHRWQIRRRERHRSSSGGEFSAPGLEIAGGGKWPWPGSVYAGYRDGGPLAQGAKGGLVDDEQRRLKESSADGSDKV